MEKENSTCRRLRPGWVWLYDLIAEYSKGTEGSLKIAKEVSVMSEIDKEIFGKFIQTQRKEKGYTQKELAQKLFISDKAVSKWERGVSRS